MQRHFTSPQCPKQLLITSWENFRNHNQPKYIQIDGFQRTTFPWHYPQRAFKSMNLSLRGPQNIPFTWFIQYLSHILKPSGIIKGFRGIVWKSDWISISHRAALKWLKYQTKITHLVCLDRLFSPSIPSAPCVQCTTGSDFWVVITAISKEIYNKLWKGNWNMKLNDSGFCMFE